MRRASVVDTETRESDLLALQAAKLYFRDQLTKTEIAQRIGISRFRVARLIDEALHRGLVTIRFASVPSIDEELSSALAEQYALGLCLVAQSSARDGDGFLAAAATAASLLTGLVQPGDVLGVAWGSTVAATVEAVAHRPVKDLHVVQLAGGTRRIDPKLAPPEIARRLAERLGATVHPLYAPALVESTAVRDAFMREGEVRATTALYDRVTVALVGIGAFASVSGQSALLQSGALSDDEVTSAQASGAVADLVLHAVAADGTLVPTAIEERAIAISFEQLRRIPRVIAVAANADKAPAIAAVLRTGIVSALVTERAAAQALLETEVNRGRGGEPMPDGPAVCST
jgi:DNA-binding transcriptional regulator LsrR (DeoR family)